MRFLFLSFLLLLAAPAAAEPPAGFAQRVEQLRRQFGAPGATVAIVENGRTTFAQGFGIRDLGAPQGKVDADTLFQTGSTGKAFTVAALAVLVDQGKLEWDDKVIDHMPDFRMWDPWVTREMTVRDLLVHRSGLGLGAGDLLFVPSSNLSREETVRRIRHIKPATSFRSGYAYDNILYMVAGQLIEEVSGQSWEEFMVGHVLRPAGMTRSTVSDSDRMRDPNRARPHARLNGAIRGLGDQEPLDERLGISPNAAPAGGLAISANDMANWLKIQLAQGAIPGTDRRLFSEEQSLEMWTPAVLTPNGKLPDYLKATQPMFSTYALGWSVQDYRGARLVWHGGAVFGSLAAVALLPERNVGLYVAVNAEEGQMVRGLMYELLDHYLGLPKDSWPEKLNRFKQERAAAAVKALQAPAAQPADVGPSLPLARYAGRYADPWYGTITITERDGRLHVDFPHTPGLAATLEHWQYDTFKTRFNDSNMEPAFVTFQLDADGKVDRITMKAVSPLADFSFDYHDLLFRPVEAEGGDR